MIPGLGRSPGEGDGYPLQYSGLENSMDGGAWRGYSPWGHRESDTTEPLTVLPVRENVHLELTLRWALLRALLCLLTSQHPRGRFCYYPHFIGESSEVQRA